MKSAFNNSEGQFDDKEREFQAVKDWCNIRQKQSPQFKFWGSVLNFELLVFCFVRAYRESDFQLYQGCLSELIPYFFALDHINYARWFPVHLPDMLALEQMHPGVYKEFSRGHFAVRKTEKTFSIMAIDQAHEQNNAVSKGDRGVIGLTEDQTALRRWTVAGPELSRLVDEFPNITGNRQNEKKIKATMRQHALFRKTSSEKSTN